MLKLALFFAGSGIAMALVAPSLLPMPDQTRRQATPVSAASPETLAVAAPSTASASSGFRELQVPEQRGQYFVDAYVEGVPVHFVVDTGASIVTLSADTARRIGLVDSARAPHYLFSTANGQTQGYGVTLKSVDLGSIYVSDVTAAVSPNTGMNLLGETFLRRLTAVEQREGRMILRQ